MFLIRPRKLNVLGSTNSNKTRTEIKLSDNRTKHQNVNPTRRGEKSGTYQNLSSIVECELWNSD